MTKKEKNIYEDVNSDTTIYEDVEDAIDKEADVECKTEVNIQF